MREKERENMNYFFVKKWLNDKINYYFSLNRKNTEVKRILKNSKYL